MLPEKNRKMKKRYVELILKLFNKDNVIYANWNGFKEI